MAVDLSTISHLREGAEFDTARRTVTEADIVNFAGLSNDFNPLHVDAQFAAEESPFGRPIAHGQLIAAIVTGLRSTLDDWPVISYLAAGRQFTAPVFAGDTIFARYEVSEVRESKSVPGAVVVSLDLRVVNQDQDVVIHGDDVMLVEVGSSEEGGRG